MRLKETVLEDEIATPLQSPGRFKITKIYQGQFIDMEESTDSHDEASKRINYLNNRSWNAVYMVRKIN